MESTLLAIITISVAVLSLLGTLLQYIFPVKLSKATEKSSIVEQENTKANTVNIISETYERLVNDINNRLTVLEEEVRMYKQENEVLERKNGELEIVVEEQGRRIQKYEKEIKNLKAQLKKMRELEKK
jgi:chromosome segregation ATPase